MQLTMLGVGSSAGTPAVGCTCATCSSDNPRNKRTRCSSMVTLDDGRVILIDTTPDLRQQALREQMRRVDAVLYTHTHADHLHGIDDLRAFCQINRCQIPIYSYAEAIRHIQEKFGYTIREPIPQFWDLPVLAAHVVDAPFEAAGQTVTPIPVMHGKIRIHAYRIGNLVYMTDVSEIPETSYPLLQNVDLLLIDCLREKPHPTHVSVEESLGLIALIGARRNVLIHMTHELEYHALQARMPANVQVGYDGMKLDF
ncbi:MBL fold metallo-hydrolase [Methylophilus medardicus]|uniref:MBL fold metallo-hydrolase n=1 Tax=Methylophilus medardicus TaxID=2588534 RepID=A0A5B8CSH0_9PROT|nr:MBL fold metallo-hydrolase [Methylophilus medardicus]QDC44268.1 MBL fold metallo-hydrolase [Methylophilus medardicus]QDC49275.1 MBL fold metallo-hydrolase [Methylophilus medardicus]QDC52980.1 MBL fold metallo-hydrolase [Methylophilus medardicus]